MTTSTSPIQPSNNPWKWATFVLVGIIIGYGFSALQGGATQVSVVKTDGNTVQTVGSPEGPSEEEVEETGEPLDVSEDDDPWYGDKNAPITMIEFSDYQCYYCHKFHQESLSQIKENYVDTGLVKLVYRDFPGSSHKNAIPAAEAAECAEEQGEDYWAMHDRIFDGYNEWAPVTEDVATEIFKGYAEELGYDTATFNSCMDNHDLRDEVIADRTEGYEEYGVDSTPTFFINGFRVVGAQPYEVWESIFEQLLAEQ